VRLIITGGGTGGHLFPALAVARGVRERWPGSEILFIGTNRAVDSKALAGEGFERRVLPCSGLKGMGNLARIRSLAVLPGAVLGAMRMIRSFRPDLVFSVGGYVTGPVVAAARLLGVPVCLHEQNSVPGLANRLAGRLADRICLSMACRPSFPAGKTVLTGNPVREEIIRAAADRAGTSGCATLLVLGGSQGAHRINRLMAEAASHLADTAIRIVHQTGEKDRDWVARAYAESGIEARVESFFTDMAGLYRRADLVVSRAGATTLAELAVMGLPALLIPYPHAADDHQMSNAHRYADRGGALVVAESELDAALLAVKVKTLMSDPKRLKDMGRAMSGMAMTDATRRILDVCWELTGNV